MNTIKNEVSGNDFSKRYISRPIKLLVQDKGSHQLLSRHPVNQLVISS